MHNGEHGVVFRMNVDYDISGYDSLSLVFTKPSTGTLTKTARDLTVGASDVETDLGTFSTSQYIEYTFADGEVDEAGNWTAQLTYTKRRGVKLIGDKARFLVSA